jgi:general secretion pathway protein K
MTRRTLSPRQRGFALLIVLWSMALLALIGTRITAAGHAETRLAINLRSEAVAEAAADGAVFEGLYRVLGGSGVHWPADGQPRRIRLPQAVADVAVFDESQKVTLNNSALPVLEGLLRAVGVERSLAITLSAQIGDWRSPAQFPLPQGAKAPQYKAAGRDWGPPNQPFRSMDELALVLSMTPEILERLRPYVSPWVDSSPRMDVAAPVIQAALSEAAAAGAPPLVFDEPATLTIVAVAVSDTGGRFARRMVVRLNGELGADPSRPPYYVLDWDQVPG